MTSSDPDTTNTNSGDQVQASAPASTIEENHHSLPVPEPARAHVSTWKSRLSTAAGVAGNGENAIDYSFTSRIINISFLH